LRFTTVSRRWFGFLLAIASLDAVRAAGESASPAFDRKSLEEHIRYLASDERAGRGNGAQGLDDAAQYIRKSFEALGLEPVGDGGTYLQTFRVKTGQELGRRTSALLRTPDGARTLEYGKDFEPLSLSPSGEVEAPVVFVGYGVTAPEHEYDDYASVDVRGRVVLLLRYAPQVFGEQGWHATFIRKVENAASHGAAAVLVVNGPRNHREDKIVPFRLDVGAEETASIPTVHLKREHGETLLRASGRSLLDLQSRIDEELSPRSFIIEGVSVALTVDVRRTTVTVANVLGFLPARAVGSLGMRPRPREHIVIGAHYDHLGLGEKGSRDRRSRGLVHNGADDNASGVAGVLELARAFTRETNRPRGILFAAFAGEELGLRGSYHYTSHPALPLKDAVAMINLDMIGRLRHDLIYLGGVDQVPQLREGIEERLEGEGLALSGRFSADEASDHAPFLRAGVPALFFFTGLHGDYHKPTDDVQFINFDGMARVLRASYGVSSDLLQGRERPKFVAIVREPKPHGKKAAAYLGIGIDAGFDGEGVRFAYVADDGPAARAGLEAGDVLLEIDGRTVDSGDRASSLIRERQPGETVSAKIRRKGQILEVMVRLASWP
jgi:hypothetical protein